MLLVKVVSLDIFLKETYKNMLNDKINIKELATIFHESSAEDGFHLYELQRLYREIFRLRLEKFRKDFKKINNLLKGYVNTHIGEWKITCTKVDMFPKTDPDEAFRRILKASRSSQDVEYIILFDDITEEFKIERNENEGKKISELKIVFLTDSTVNFTQYQDFALFGDWFYRLKNEIEDELH